MITNESTMLFFSGINVVPGKCVTTGKHQINLTANGFDITEEVSETTSLRHQVLRPVLPTTLSICEPLQPTLREVALGDYSLPIQPGLTMIIGQSTVGKTTLLNELLEPHEVLIWNEPRAEALFSTVEVAVALASKLKDHDIIGIDSFSSILYEGPTKIEKGLSAESLNALVRIDAFCKQTSKAIIATFAPMILNAETLQAISRSIVNQKISTGIYLPQVGVIEISQRGVVDRAWKTVNWTPTKEQARVEATTNGADNTDEVPRPFGSASSIADGGHIAAASRTHARYHTIMARLAADTAETAALADGKSA